MLIFVNVLTFLRVIATFLLPLLWGVLIKRPLILLSFVALILLTDFFDGLLARKFKVSTLFGSLADSIADKMFGIIVLLIVAKYIPIFYLPFILELVISLINLVAAFLGATVKSSFLGKTKMWFLGISILTGLISIFDMEILTVLTNKCLIEIMRSFVDNEKNIINFCVLLTSGMEIMVAVDYYRHIYKELKKQNKKMKYDFKDNKDIKEALFDHEFYLKHKDEPVSKSILK